uniref:Uncharacterized protein n=1 Tax=Aplanochytrium stocchinoi TaxID=215587 RepID=A0A7S3LIB1_9STRA
MFVCIIIGVGLIQKQTFFENRQVVAAHEASVGSCDACNNKSKFHTAEHFNKIARKLATAMPLLGKRQAQIIPHHASTVIHIFLKLFTVLRIGSGPQNCKSYPSNTMCLSKA